MLPSDLSLPPRFKEFRKHQLDSAIEISTGEERFDILEAPAGSGKSLIYMTVALIKNARTLVLVKTKYLQDQVVKEFCSIGAVDVRGHNNYQCLAVEDRYVNCADGPCHTGMICSLKENGCLSFDARRRGKDAKIVVTNVAMWTTLNRYSNARSVLGHFELLVIDEAHFLPEWLADSFKTVLTKRDLEQYSSDLYDAGSEDISEWSSWAKYVLPSIRHDYKECRLSQNKDGLKEIEELGHKVKLLSKADEHPDEWLIENKRSSTIFSLRWASMYAEKSLFCSIPKVILTSAILPDKTADNLGIGKSERNRIELPSLFKPSHRLVVWIPTVRVDFRMTSGDKSTLYRKMDNIISRGLDYKCIVHTRSYARQREVLFASSYRSIMLTDLNEWLDSKPPYILVSPIVEEGYDFVGDLCRYQIILKLPRLDKRNIEVAARAKHDRGYSDLCTGISIVQTVGRITRNRSDWGVNYVIDDHWVYFRNKPVFPQYFRAAFKKSVATPEIIPPI